MAEPAKPFACTIQDCGMSFTNEDHLNVHTKKHDMVLQFGTEHKGVFVADQTPTPTRFIRNCEEVGLFQDLQNVNPFDEGFKRAMESKQCVLDGISTPSSADDLHTPQMYPLLDTDAVYTTNQKNITISRSSSDESGAIKEFETTTISKLTNEVTTISRIVEKHDDAPKIDKDKKDVYRNTIKILSNVEIRNDKDVKREKDPMPIMTQQSIDNVVESLTKDYAEVKKDYAEAKKDHIESKKDYEVILKLPSGQQIKLIAEEEADKPKATEVLKKALTEKAVKNNIGPIVVPSVIPLNSGTLIPVNVLSSVVVNNVTKLPLKVFDKRPVKRKSDDTDSDKCVRDKERIDKESRKAASKRYRVKDKATKQRLFQENSQLKRLNEKLQQEKTALKLMIMEHMKKCPNCDDFRNHFSTNGNNLAT